jgi:hypothetical protein
LIAQVLEASRLPSQVGITHCKAHQTDSSIITRGNNQASSPPNCTPIGHVPSYPSFLPSSH